MYNFNKAKVNRGKKATIAILTFFSIVFINVVIGLLLEGEIFISLVICSVVSLVGYLFYKGNKKAYFIVMTMVSYGIWNILFIVFAEGSRRLGWLSDLDKLEPSQIATRWTIVMLLSAIPVLWICVNNKTMEHVKTFLDYQRERA